MLSQWLIHIYSERLRSKDQGSDCRLGESYTCNHILLEIANSHPLVTMRAPFRIRVPLVTSIATRSLFRHTQQLSQFSHLPPLLILIMLYFPSKLIINSLQHRLQKLYSLRHGAFRFMSVLQFLANRLHVHVILLFGGWVAPIYPHLAESVHQRRGRKTVESWEADKV